MQFLGAVKHKQNQIRFMNRRFGPLNPNLLYNIHRFTDSRRIKQLKRNIVNRYILLNNVARCPRNVCNNRFVLSRKSIHQRGFPYIRTPDNRRRNPFTQYFPLARMLQQLINSARHFRTFAFNELHRHRFHIMLWIININLNVRQRLYQ
ncbi:hypothetical protein D3C73_833910 [compost metagenome]